jgi:hypothetical protein
MLPRPDGKIWAEAGRRAAEELGIPLSAFAIGPGGDFEEPEGCRADVHGLAAGGAGAGPAGWTRRLAQPQQLTGKPFTSFRGPKFPDSGVVWGRGGVVS